MLAPLVLLLSGLVGAAGIVLAALAAHGGEARLIGTAAGVALVHAPALLALGLAAASRPRLAWPALALFAGLALFCGDLALRASTGLRLFPSAAPAGGVLLIGGWLAAGGLAAYSVKRG